MLSELFPKCCISEMRMSTVHRNKPGLVTKHGVTQNLLFPLSFCLGSKETLVCVSNWLVNRIKPVFFELLWLEEKQIITSFPPEVRNRELGWIAWVTKPCLHNCSSSSIVFYLGGLQIFYFWCSHTAQAAGFSQCTAKCRLQESLGSCNSS